MGWTAYYQVVRDRLLDDKELDAVAKLVRIAQKRKWDGEPFGLVVATAARPSKIIAKGWNKLGHSGSSFDPTLLEQTLDKLRALLFDADVRVADDLEMIGKLRELETDTDDDGWTSVLSLVPPPPPKHPQILVDALAMLAAERELDEKTRTNVEVVRKAFTALGKNEIEKAELKTLVAACDPDVVAQLGLSTYARLEDDARTTVREALRRVRDPRALTDALLHAWTTPRGLHYYNDFRGLPDAFVRVVGADTRVREQWIADLETVEQERASSDRDARRGERAAGMLGQSRDPEALASLAAVLLRQRVRKTMSFTVEYSAYVPALRALAEAASPPWIATTLLAIDGMTKHWAAQQVIEHSIVTDAELALPIVREMLQKQIAPAATLAAVMRAGPLAASLEDVVVPYLDYPQVSRRAEAAMAIAMIRGATEDEARARYRANEPPPIDPEPHVAHADGEVRRESLRAVFDRKDPSLFLALVRLWWIDAILRSRSDDSILPFSWFDWKIVPKKIVEERSAQTLLAWGQGEGAGVIGPQRTLPALAPLEKLDRAGVLAHYGDGAIRFDPTTIAALSAREQASLR